MDMRSCPQDLGRRRPGGKRQARRSARARLPRRVPLPPLPSPIHPALPAAPPSAQRTPSGGARDTPLPAGSPASSRPRPPMPCGPTAMMPLAVDPIRCAQMPRPMAAAQAAPHPCMMHARFAVRVRAHGPGGGAAACPLGKASGQGGGGEEEADAGAMAAPGRGGACIAPGFSSP